MKYIGFKIAYWVLVTSLGLFLIHGSVYGFEQETYLIDVINNLFFGLFIISIAMIVKYKVFRK